MKFNKITSVLVSTALLVLLACSSKEESVELPPLPSAENAAQATTEPELQPIAPSEIAPVAQKPPASATSAPSSAGNYVIQVDIKPSRKAADRVIEKLRANGIESYAAEVANPGELEGTYYRVRIGYFAGIPEATEYAKNTLAPLGYAWWIDHKKHDSVGNPSTDSQASSYSEPTQPTYWQQTTPPPAPVESAPQPVVQPEPQPEPQPAPQAQPAPTPTEPTTQPSSPSTDDDWQ